MGFCLFYPRGTASSVLDRVTGNYNVGLDAIKIRGRSFCNRPG